MRSSECRLATNYKTTFPATTFLAAPSTTALRTPESPSIRPGAGRSAGIAIGTIAGLFLVAAILYLIVRVRRTKKETAGGRGDSEWWDHEIDKAGSSSGGLAGGIRVIRG